MICIAAQLPAAKLSRSTRIALMRAFDELRRKSPKGYRLDTTSHINANHNRNMIKAAFTVARETGISNERHIQHMQYVKNKLREHDAQPAAWFFGPKRSEWVMARVDRGEKMTNEEFSREMMGYSWTRIKEVA